MGGDERARSVCQQKVDTHTRVHNKNTHINAYTPRHPCMGGDGSARSVCQQKVDTHTRVYTTNTHT